MVEAARFLETLHRHGFDFFAGVPDSLLKDFCAYILENVDPLRNIIAANEGNAVGLACGWHLATGNAGVVYMQNSGEGNAVNPLLSIADPEIYSIPMLLLIGWRGRPGVKDEPQHVKQGKVTCSLLDAMGIPYVVLTEDWERELEEASDRIWNGLRPGGLVVPKGFFAPYPLRKPDSPYAMAREEAIEAVLDCLGPEELVVSTTGKASRELFEARERRNQSHGNDFLTVGGMGHTSSIALGVALGTDRNVWCLDGDGSMIMHMGALAIASQKAPSNFKYILNDNASHESVGGQPTATPSVDLPGLLRAAGFRDVVVASTQEEVARAMSVLRASELGALILKTRPGSRSDLGRPTTTPVQNKTAFMRQIGGVE